MIATVLYGPQFGWRNTRAPLPLVSLCQPNTGTVTAKNPTQTEISFFDAKRSWSVIKDRVLGNYMRPYLTKVRLLGRPIILVDCFAGEGKFGDDQPGSPLIMCEMA